MPGILLAFQTSPQNSTLSLFFIKIYLFIAFLKSTEHILMYMEHEMVYDHTA